MPRTSDASPQNRVPIVLNAACLVTYSGALAAIVAMSFAVLGQIQLALVALMFAGLADLFDGVVARRLVLDAIAAGD